MASDDRTPIRTLPASAPDRVAPERDVPEDL
jgi:hypothetical protein